MSVPGHPSPTASPVPAIRSAEPGHLSAIADIWHRGWVEVHHGHVPDSLLAHRTPADILMRATESLASTHVALLGTNVVGFIIVHEDEVEHLYVAPDARKAGIAGLLLARGEALIGAHSKVAWLAVVRENAHARHFYERHGWHNAGEFMQQARIAEGSVPVPALRYEKRLAHEVTPRASDRHLGAGRGSVGPVSG